MTNIGRLTFLHWRCLPSEFDQYYIDYPSRSFSTQMIIFGARFSYATTSCCGYELSGVTVLTVSLSLNVNKNQSLTTNQPTERLFTSLSLINYRLVWKRTKSWSMTYTNLNQSLLIKFGRDSFVDQVNRARIC